MPRQLRRSVNNKVIGGVCAGIARYLDLDPTVVRVAYVLLTIFTISSGAWVYLILWLLIPEEEYY